MYTIPPAALVEVIYMKDGPRAGNRTRVCRVTVYAFFQLKVLSEGNGRGTLELNRVLKGKSLVHQSAMLCPVLFQKMYRLWTLTTRIGAIPIINA